MKFVLPPYHIIYPFPSPPVLYVQQKKKKEGNQNFPNVQLFYVVHCLKGKAKAKPHLLKCFL